MEEPEPPWGVVPVDGRGSLPFALVHGESLVAAASWALTTAGAELFDYDVAFDAVRESGRALVDPRPAVPADPRRAFSRTRSRSAANSGAVVVGVRPVTDTVKEYDDDLCSAATVDRDDLVCVTSPVVLPGRPCSSSLEDLDTDDLAELVAALTSRFPVRFLPAPALGRRIAGEGDLEVLAGAQLDGALSSRSARARSSGKVTLRFAAVLGTPTTVISAYRSRQAAVSVPTNPSASARR